MGQGGKPWTWNDGIRSSQDGIVVLAGSANHHAMPGGSSGARVGDGSDSPFQPLGRMFSTWNIFLIFSSRWMYRLPGSLRLGDQLPSILTGLCRSCGRALDG